MKIVEKECHVPARTYIDKKYVATDGNDVFKATWDSLHGYYCKYDSGIFLPLFNSELDKWWWADIVQTAHKTPEFNNTNLMEEQNESKTSC